MGGRGEHRAGRSLLPGESASPQSPCVFCEEVMEPVSPVNYGLPEVQSRHMKEVTQGFRTGSGLSRIPELTEAERQSFLRVQTAGLSPREGNAAPPKRSLCFCRVFLAGWECGGRA